MSVFVSGGGSSKVLKVLKTQHFQQKIGRAKATPTPKCSYAPIHTCVCVCMCVCVGMKMSVNGSCSFCSVVHELVEYELGTPPDFYKGYTVTRV